MSSEMIGCTESNRSDFDTELNRFLLWRIARHCCWGCQAGRDGARSCASVHGGSCGPTGESALRWPWLQRACSWSVFCGWKDVQVRLDISHLMRRLARGCTVQNHQLLYGVFMSRPSTCIYSSGMPCPC